MDFEKLKMFLKVLLTFVLICDERTQGHYSHEIKSDMSEEYEKSFEGSISKRSYGFEMEPVNFEDLKSCKMCGIDRFPPEEGSPKDNKMTPTFKFPWIVSIQKKRRKICAGAIISEKFILTSAHCLLENKAPLERVRELLKNETIDDQRRDIWEPPLLTRTEEIPYLKPEVLKIGYLTHTDYIEINGPDVEEVIPNPNYHVDWAIHDIGLLKLKEKLTCSKLRNPVCLPSPDMDVKEGKIFNVSGWDIDWYETLFTIDPSKELKQLKVKYVNFSKCEEFFPRRLNVSYYCVENTKSNESCHADPGGPLFSKEEDGKYHVFGVASLFAYDACWKNSGFMYTRILEYMEWIKNTTGLEPPKFLSSSGLQGECKKGEKKCNED